MDETPLEQAERHVIETRARIARQMLLIDLMIDRGTNEQTLENARRLLGEYRHALTLAEQIRAHERREAGEWKARVRMAGREKPVRAD
jgi:hypothetical protein